jgi:hypothetical protein
LTEILSAEGRLSRTKEEALAKLVAANKDFSTNHHSPLTFFSVAQHFLVFILIYSRFFHQYLGRGYPRDSNMNIIQLTEDYLGDELTAETATRFTEPDIPLEHLIGYLEKAAPYYYDWLENAEKQAASETREIYHPLDPYLPAETLDGAIARYKALLLYFPAVTIEDPVAKAIWPACTMAEIMRVTEGEPYIPLTDETEVALRRDIREAFKLLAAFRPLTQSGDVSLVPSAFALFYTVVQEAARKELEALERENLMSLYGQGDNGIVGAVKVWCKVCEMCEYTPVAGRDWVSKILSVEYQQAAGRLKPVAGIDTRVTQDLWQYRLPGVEQAPVNEIISLRRNHDAFAEWRNALCGLLEQVRKEAPTPDPAQFETEFKRAAEAQLTPKLQAIRSSIGQSQVLSKMLVPGLLTLGGGVITYIITQQPFTAGAVTSALAPVSWIADKMIKRYNREGRKEGILRDFYGYLSDRVPEMSQRSF